MGGEGLRLLGGDNGVSGNDLSEDTTDGFDTQGQGSDIEQQNTTNSLIRFRSQDTSLNGSTIGNGFIRVNTSVGFLSVEEVLDQLLDLGDSGGTTNKNNFVDISLLHVVFLEDLVDGTQGLLEQIVVQIFELGSGKSLGEIKTVNQGFDFHLDLMGRRQGTLGTFDFSSQLLDGSLVA
mmetsp:Transcript_63863/g.73238  ORF Transcript_63863/g.73238 Transcript_63863/m.73238 type:complete len:178 (-) Transcript_63863:964-1497(-)